MMNKIDSLGRIVIPKAIRSKLHLQTGDVLQMQVNDDENSVILKKKDKNCICCGGKEDLISFSKNVSLCKSCLSKAKEE